MLMRAGGAIYDNTDSVPGLTLANPSQYPFPDIGFGVNFGPHWGIELTLDYTETHVGIPGVTARVGEYATWALTPQIRYRYPFFDGRLVPYVLGGVGVGFGGFNDRNAAHDDIQIGASDNTTMITTLGVGLEYYFYNNLAVGIEAKRITGFDADITYNGQPYKIDMNQTFLTGGLRIMLDDPGDSNGFAPFSTQGVWPRPYVLFSTGTAFFTNPDSHPVLTIDSPKRVFFGSAAGVDLNRHWSLEMSFDYWEPALKVAGLGEVAEYALWTILGNVRYRVPLMNGRLEPYLIAGTGIGYAQVNDRRIRAVNYPLQSGTFTSIVGSAGVGIDYFLNPNVAIGLQSKYVFLFDNDLTAGNVSGTLDNNTILTQATLRILFP